jgi:uracil-DNA glycosylase
METLISYTPEILKGIDPSWNEIIDKTLLAETLSSIYAADTTPPAPLIFEAFRYVPVHGVKVVIIAQDPYPKPSDADGLCFSVKKDRPIPKSLGRIFGCLERANLRPQGSPIGDLRSWAVQGVLMLNATLTTKLGISRAHTKVWKPFIDELMRRFCHSHPGPLTFLLWGRDAAVYQKVASSYGHTVRTWTHPSPLCDAGLAPEVQFRMCPHFIEVNELLGSEGIVWDNRASIIAFTDGSASQNGKPGARAGFAAVITGGQFGETIIRGEVIPRTYQWAEDSGLGPGYPAPTEQPAPPSNNRGEFMGMIYCLLALIKGCAIGNVEIISDSELVINTLLEWFPNRKKQRTEKKLKNLDLVLIAWDLYEKLRKQAYSVTLTHVYSHTKLSPSATPREILAHSGNAIADKNAKIPIARPPTYEVEVLGVGPIILGTLKRSV